MNIAEKCALLKADMDALHKAGGNTEEAFEQGRQDVISKSKYIEKTASGKLIALNDVSEVYHDVTVKADTPTEVKVCGKNLFNNDFSLVKPVTYTSSSGTQGTRNGYEIHLPAGVYTATLQNTSAATDIYWYGAINDANGNYVQRVVLLQSTENRTPLTFTINEGDVLYWYDGYEGRTPQKSWDLCLSLCQVMLEAGYASTPYEPYQEPYIITATPDGTEVDSICPTMTFLADSEITVDYYSSYGMQTEYDRFWDTYQDNGNRTNYSYGFAHTGWTNRTFKPKYDMALNGAAQMFYYSRITDLVGILEKQGVVINTSNASSVTYMYGYSVFTRIPLADLSSATNTTYLYAGDTALISIEKIISSEKTVFASSCFSNCSELEHCIFEGTIASDINLQWSTKLSLESLISLVECLKRYETTDSNYRTKTITLSAESWALLDTYASEAWPEWSGAKDWVGGWYGWNYA